MAWFRELRRSLAVLFHRDRFARELEEEIQSHLEMQAGENRTRGMPADQALTAARRRFGNAAWLAESGREVWGLAQIERLLQDVAYALRLLRKNPGWASVTIATLALGIGATTAIFSVVNDFLLRPLPFRDPARLVTVGQYDVRHTSGSGKGYTSPPNFLDWKAQNHVFEDMACWDATADQFNLTGGNEPERVHGARVSSNFFSVLGVSPIIGNGFGAKQDKRGGDDVAILGYGLWQRQFGGSPDVLGKNVMLDGRPYRIAGVMPRGFRFSVPPEEVWLPMGGTLRGGRGGFHLYTLARLKPGIGLGKAQAEMDAIGGRLALAYPFENRNSTARVASLRDHYSQALRPALVALMAAVGIVLLIACANVAGLLVARASSRQAEMAIRRAIGASRVRILRQVLTESTILALIGGTLGFVLAFWGVRLFYRAVPAPMHPLEPAGMDVSVFVFTLAVSLATGGLFGTAPAWSAAAVPRRSVRRGQLRKWLVASEVALSAVLLVGAGLLMKSFVRLLDTDLGFRAENVLTASLSYTKPNENAFYSQVLERLAAHPEVRAAGAAGFIPIAPQGWGQDIYAEGAPPRAPGDFTWVGHRSVSLDYFRAIGMRLVAGRSFTREDARLPVGIVNQAMARTFWPDRDPIGRRFKIGVDSERWITVIGVVADAKASGLEDPAIPEMYFLESMPRMTLVVRAAQKPAALAGAVKAAIRSVDPGQPISEIRTMREIISDSTGPRRLTMMLTAIFGGMALLLAAVGLYGLISYSVAQRNHEFGIRMALGARPAGILRVVIGEGFLLLAGGGLIGLAGAWALARVMRTLLYGVDVHDPAIFVIVPLVLCAAAVLATYLPARRAAKVNPVEALRYE